eukprot:TRINITY_DN4693_c0_g1_i4.p2 TRINITY_DN4693_c0_g1~~TRINITY_DN4693_c0_g1_i4.p2  ORF type:complete len:331 (-),score=33.02 TRINITY_DN4693_c0_g1_i4:2596-3588(-)
MADSLSALHQLKQLEVAINEASCLRLPQMSREEIERLNVPEFGTPSGPRQGRHGMADSRQGILSAQLTRKGDMVLRVTLLCSGFIIGKRGQSVGQINKSSGAVIESREAFVDALRTEDSDFDSPNVRVFIIKGYPQCVLNATEIIMHVAQHYRDLVYGRIPERVVYEEQIVMGMKFWYKPPPLRDMPNAVRTYKEDIVYNQEYQQDQDQIDYEMHVRNTAFTPFAPVQFQHYTGQFSEQSSPPLSPTQSTNVSPYQSVGMIPQPQFSLSPLPMGYYPYPYSYPQMQYYPHPYPFAYSQPHPYPYPQQWEAYPQNKQLGLEQVHPVQNEQE